MNETGQRYTDQRSKQARNYQDRGSIWPRHRRTVIFLPHCTQTMLAGALLACLAGCTSFPWRRVPLDVASGFYSDATLTYQVDAGKLGQPLDVVHIESQRISYEQVASSPLPDESIGTLTITMPHPAGKTGFALAQFTLASTKEKPDKKPTLWNPLAKESDVPEAPAAISTTQPDVYERWELDIPKAEVDQILKAINGEGFYQSERSGPAHLAVKMDGVKQSKEWREIPVLNLLIQRIRTTGQLIAYVRPSMSDGSMVRTIPDAVDYGAMWAHGDIPDMPRPNVASAFALPRMPAQPAPQNVPPGYPATQYPANLAQNGPPGLR